jgi:hypothetical protein
MVSPKLAAETADGDGSGGHGRRVVDVEITAELVKQR